MELKRNLYLPTVTVELTLSADFNECLAITAFIWAELSLTAFGGDAGVVLGVSEWKVVFAALLEIADVCGVVAEGDGIAIAPELICASL
jgi:hypothetical protein